MKYRGRPAKYEDPAQMQALIDEYFKECIKTKEVPTVSGLAYTLDLERKSLLDYEKCLETDRFKRFPYEVRVAFVNTIKEAKKYIEMNYEQALFDKAKTVGAIFTLKNNYGYVDKTEQVIENKTIDIDLKD